MRSGFAPAWVRLPPNLNAKFITISCPWRRVCVGEFTCPCSPVVLAWHCITRTAESDRPRVRDPHEQDSESRTRDLHVNRRCDYAVYTTKRDAPTCSQTRRLTSPLRGLNEFCIEIRRESNPRGSKPRSHTVSDLNHSANQVYTIGTECSHHM